MQPPAFPARPLLSPEICTFCQESPRSKKERKMENQKKENEKTSNQQQQGGESRTDTNKPEAEKLPGNQQSKTNIDKMDEAEKTDEKVAS
jgi:hypothetical protein